MPLASTQGVSMSQCDKYEWWTFSGWRICKLKESQYFDKDGARSENIELEVTRQWFDYSVNEYNQSRGAILILSLEHIIRGKVFPSEGGFTFSEWI